LGELLRPMEEGETLWPQMQLPVQALWAAQGSFLVPLAMGSLNMRTSHYEYMWHLFPEVDRTVLPSVQWSADHRSTYQEEPPLPRVAYGTGYLQCHPRPCSSSLVGLGPEATQENAAMAGSAANRFSTDNGAPTSSISAKVWAGGTVCEAFMLLLTVLGDCTSHTRNP
jgi:hypothetical protein